MLQINASTSPSSRASAAGADAPGQQPASAGGFDALLDGLLGAVVPSVIQVEQARPITLANAVTETLGEPIEAGEAAARDALPSDTLPGGSGTPAPAEMMPARGRGDTLDASARALPVAPGPAAAPAAGAGDEAVEPAPSRGQTIGQPLPPSGGKQATGEPATSQQTTAEAVVAERSRAGRPLGDAGTESRSIGNSATSETARAEQHRPLAVEASRKDGEQPLDPVASIQQAKAQKGIATLGRAEPDTISLRSVVAGQPAALGPLLVGSHPALARLPLPVDWSGPADTPGAIGLTATSALPGAAERAALASVEMLAGSAQPAIRQLAAAIDRAVGGELRQLTIQLNPKALGSIEIALEFDADHRLGMVILAERPETLELLRSDARELQRLLAQQGIDLSESGLELGLMGGERHHGQPSDGEQEASAEGSGSGARSRDSPANDPEPSRLDLVGTTGRLNLTI